MERNVLPGKFVHFELIASDPEKAHAFYAELFGWDVRATPGQPSRWISYVSVPDVDAAVMAARLHHGEVIEPAADRRGLGRTARIRDPLGAELALIARDGDDPADAKSSAPGQFFWNELHTTDPARVLGFYAEVVGFAHRSQAMGPGNTYHLLSRGGVDRAGATAHLGTGVRPHWLPYVHVDDADAALARATRLGATLPVPAADIPGIGRFGVLQDPTGALLALMKPLPRG